MGIPLKATVLPVETSRPDPVLDPADLAFQQAILPGVSRTFALTIPELPAGLREAVTNSYLLCRIADTIEDEPALDPGRKRRFHRRFAQAVTGEGDPDALAAELGPLLSESTIPAEKELVRHAGRIVRITLSFGEREHRAIARCVRVMCEEMPRFQDRGGPRGLKDVVELHAYCYGVAGVVGEMLTELFCAHSPAIDRNRAGLEERTVSFGQGLQMTNILKDVWDDLERGFCWLPRELFLEHGFDLRDLAPGRYNSAFGDGLEELIALAHGHLVDALEYTLLIPPAEKEIRHFCLWALGMAVLTLRKIHKHPDYRSSREVKITRRSVRATILASNLSTRSDRILRILFSLCASRLPAPRFFPARS